MRVKISSTKTVVRDVGRDSSKSGPPKLDHGRPPNQSRKVKEVKTVVLRMVQSILYKRRCVTREPTESRVMGEQEYIQQTRAKVKERTEVRPASASEYPPPWEGDNLSRCFEMIAWLPVSCTELCN